jgi:hypothetical protein
MFNVVASSVVPALIPRSVPVCTASTVVAPLEVSCALVPAVSCPPSICAALSVVDPLESSVV